MHFHQFPRRCVLVQLIFDEPVKNYIVAVDSFLLRYVYSLADRLILNSKHHYEYVG